MTTSPKCLRSQPFRPRRAKPAAAANVSVVRFAVDGSLRGEIELRGLRGMEFVPAWSGAEEPLVQNLIEPVPIAPKTVIPPTPSE
jgi:hypothetical protein